jgi:hypothetical protein
MSTLSAKILYWSPRGLCIAFSLFLSLFALDVFGEGLGVWRTAIALVMHLMPVFVLLLALALAWRWEWVGAVTFSAAAALYMWWAGWNHRYWWPGIAGPAVVIGVLFLVNWIKRDELRRLNG